MKAGAKNKASSELPRCRVPPCGRKALLIGDEIFGNSAAGRWGGLAGADRPALHELLGNDDEQTTTHLLPAFEALGVDWSGESVEKTLEAMRLESGPVRYREGPAKYDCPFALMDTVEGYIAERSREYAAA